MRKNILTKKEKRNDRVYHGKSFLSPELSNLVGLSIQVATTTTSTDSGTQKGANGISIGDKISKCHENL